MTFSENKWKVTELLIDLGATTTLKTVLRCNMVKQSIESVRQD